tara:strand:+ start:5339 stop:5890 length:552 start_codon:yes stop_codon:yes gene_type:complete
MVTGLIAIAAVATGGSLYMQNKSYKEQKKANALQRRQAELSNARARRDEVRKNRMALAASQVTAEGQGAYESSGAYGGQGSIISQGNSNLSFIDRSAQISDQTSKHLGKAMGYSNTASIFSGVANMAMSFAAYGGGSKVKADSAVQAKAGGGPTGGAPALRHTMGVAATSPTSGYSYFSGNVY